MTVLPEVAELSHIAEHFFKSLKWPLWLIWLNSYHYQTYPNILLDHFDFFERYVRLMITVVMTVMSGL